MTGYWEELFKSSWWSFLYEAFSTISSREPYDGLRPTGSGKTYWINKLLTNNILLNLYLSFILLWSFSDYFNEMAIPNIEFHEGLPDLEKVQSLNDGKFHIIVLDDLMEHIIKVWRLKIYWPNTAIIIIFSNIS